ncbi:hypothetical protein TRFO_18634 [Tritrichomonas foetus]|uniref:Myb-like DNA-binding domain containing protein n=1 Tax=Tritrichomonas foetus TaxID=1144522 RepID=A0A1J4KKT3_9EUKA|nr:hypothetical protein TRFO_18634 [Tritrichomonas foetus]|eukprot:OHT11835.1 hypothetical protein TRFO_18634 [Tritrichomonas foetus]
MTFVLPASVATRAAASMKGSPRKPHPKAKFNEQEDTLLRHLVAKLGESNWAAVAERMPHRNMRQCKERWQNYLSPTISRDPWTPEEDSLLEQKFVELGPKWVRISMFFKNRTDANVKNRYLVLSRRKKRENNRFLQISNISEVSDSATTSDSPAANARNSSFTVIPNAHIPGNIVNAVNYRTVNQVFNDYNNEVIYNSHQNGYGTFSISNHIQNNLNGIESNFAEFLSSMAVTSELPKLQTITLPDHLAPLSSFLRDSIPPLRLRPSSVQVLPSQMSLQMKTMHPNLYKLAQ